MDAAAAPVAHQTLVGIGEPGDRRDRRLVHGTTLELIEVEDPTGRVDDLADQQRLFIAAHWAAVSATTPRTVRCGELEATIPVARRLPLVACKLHAWLDRRGAGRAKRGSDGLDIVRLIESADLEQLAADADVADGLRDAVRWAAQSVLQDDATQVRRMILAETGTKVEPVAITSAGEQLLAALESPD